MTTSFYNGITGLKSFQNGIDVWGDNIANINTVGYKQNIPEFATLFADTIKSSPLTSDVGMGSRLSSTAIDLSQGNMINTEKTFDLSLNGEGWFAVEKNGERFFTRTGSFKRDAEGYLVNDDGDYLMVANANNLIKKGDGDYMIDRNVKTDSLLPSANLTPISLPNNVILPAVPTTEVSLTTNLNDAEVITTTKYAEDKNDFSALYSKDGEDMKIRDGDSLVFGFGNPAVYEKNMISTEICINNEEADGEDSRYVFTLNGHDFDIEIPDGTSADEIKNILKDEFDKAGITSKITHNGIKISDPEEITLISKNELLPSIAAAKITYRSNPGAENEFSTMGELDLIIQKLADEVYPGVTSVYVDDEGRISIDNSSFKTINAYSLKTEKSNDLFMQNLGRLGNEIYAQTSAKSYTFLANSQSFGGKIIQADGEKDFFSVEFTKQKVLGDNILWDGKITVTDTDSNVISTKDFVVRFSPDGQLISPKEVNITSPQNILLKLNLNSYAKTDLAPSYSYVQNGIDEGFLKGYQIDRLGNIQSLFSNGEVSVLGQIPVYHFQNDQGLESIGNNLFRQTVNSNKPILYMSQNGEYIPGSYVTSGMLESSNVNMSQAMTELIVIQKAFSSAAKTVTTSDQMIQRAIDMKKG